MGVTSRSRTQRSSQDSITGSLTVAGNLSVIIGRWSPSNGRFEGFREDDARRRVAHRFAHGDTRRDARRHSDRLSHTLAPRFPHSFHTRHAHPFGRSPEFNAPPHARARYAHSSTETLADRPTRAPTGSPETRDTDSPRARPTRRPMMTTRTRTTTTYSTTTRTRRTHAYVHLKISVEKKLDKRGEGG